MGARVAGARQMLAAPAEYALPGLFAGDPPAEFVSLLEEIAAAARPESLRTQLSAFCPSAGTEAQAHQHLPRRGLDHSALCTRLAAW